MGRKLSCLSTYGADGRPVHFLVETEAEHHGPPLRPPDAAPPPQARRFPVPEAEAHEVRVGLLLFGGGLLAAVGAYVVHTFLAGFLFNAALSLTFLGGWLSLTACGRDDT